MAKMGKGWLKHGSKKNRFDWEDYAYLVGKGKTNAQIMDRLWDNQKRLRSKDRQGRAGIFDKIQRRAQKDWHPMRMFSSATVPSNWFMCYGQSKDKATYIDLFNVIGYTYGGSGANFNLPDMRGYTSIGLDNMGGSSAGRVSGATSLNYTIGTENHTLSESEIPAHTHTYTQNSGEGNGAGNTSGADSATQTRDMSTVGSSSAHNNMQPWLALNWMIKY